LGARVAELIADGQLSIDEATAVVAQVTTGTLGAIPTLVTHAVVARLQLGDETTAAAAIVEEALRHATPFLMVPRTAGAAVSVGGICIEPNERVGLMVDAANRDRTAFADPEAFCPARHDSNGHIAFGLGRHYCLGAALTRVVAEVAVEAAGSRAGTLTVGPVGHEELFGLRTARSAPVTRMERRRERAS